MQRLALTLSLHQQLCAPTCRCYPISSSGGTGRSPPWSYFQLASACQRHLARTSGCVADCVSGLSVFADKVVGRNVHLHSDNTGAEWSTKRGRARSWDHTCIVHGIWLAALRLGMGLYVSRVPSCENLSDLPSREQYKLLWKIGAVRVPPRLDAAFRNAQCWEAMALRTYV